MSQEDWSAVALKTWRGIPTPWKQAFGLALLVNIIVFFFELAQSPLGDHDVGFQSGMQLLSGGAAGRWFAPAARLLVGHKLLPVYALLMVMVAQIVAAMGAVLLWRPQAGMLSLFAAAVIVTCLPFSAEFHYFQGTAFTMALAQLLMVLALHATESRSTLSPRLPAWFCWGIALVCCTCALALYQSSLMTWAVCMGGYVLLRTLHPSANHKFWQDCCRPLLPAISAMALACILYFISLKLYPLVGLSLDMYQFQTVGASSLLSRLGEVAVQAYRHLWTPIHFMQPFVVGLLLCVCVLGTWATLKEVKAVRHSAWRVVLAIALLLLLPVAAKAQFIFSTYADWFAGRFSTFGLAYLYAFFMIVLLNASARFLRNAGFALLILTVPAMAVQSIDAQNQLVRSNIHDLHTLNRVLMQIEQHQDFDPNKTYHLVEFGRFAPYVPPGFTKSTQPFWNTLQHHWHPGFDLALLSGSLKLGERLHENASKRHDILEKAWHTAQSMPAFPAKGSVEIKDDTIILMYDRASLKGTAAILGSKK